MFEQVQDSNDINADATICLLIKNEENNLRELFPQIIQMHMPIIVADTGSTDGSLTMAEQFGAKVIAIPWSGNFSLVRNFLLECINTQWVFMIDGDERLTPELRNEIITVTSGSSLFQGYYVPRKNHFFGKWLRYGGQYPDYQLKLFQKKLVIFDKLVHEKVIIRGSVGYLKGHILHYPYSGVSHYLQKFDLYTDLGADALVQSAITPNFGHAIQWLFLKPLLRFFRRYVLKLGFLDGIPGLFAVTVDAFGYMIRYYKFWERFKKHHEENNVDNSGL